MAKKEAKSIDTKFVNPLSSGVTYAEFLKAIPKGVTVSSYLKGKLSDEEITWIENELKQIKK
jgi:hypothetical protein